MLSVQVFASNRQAPFLNQRKKNIDIDCDDKVFTKQVPHIELISLAFKTLSPDRATAFVFFFVLAQGENHVANAKYLYSSWREISHFHHVYAKFKYVT